MYDLYNSIFILFNLQILNSSKTGHQDTNMNLHILMIT